MTRLERLLSLGIAGEEDDEERLQRTSLTLFSLIAAAAAPIWTATYLVLERPLAAAMPAAYMAISIISLVILRSTGRFDVVRAMHVSALLVLPTLFQWVLGGFVNGSAVILWSLTAPLGALFAWGRRAAIGWFAAFAVAVGVSALIDPIVARTVEPLPGGVVTIFFAMNTVGPPLLAFALLLHVNRERDRAMAALRMEQATSERLLLNVLPESIARRLKGSAEVIADLHDDVTVLFADVVGFTPFAERTPPERVVELLNRVFSAFDELADRFGLEKIKTIGDAYMAVAGVPEPRADHAEAVAEMAMAMQSEAERCVGDDWPGLQIRVGIDTGTVMAGVIGLRKFAYDLWGDTVNTAGRMEAQGLPGRVQVTERVERLLRDRYAFERRGEIDVKGKGPMTTYVLLGRLGSSRRRSDAS